MHKPFYASGFLYHLKTQQILLHQLPIIDNASPLWTMLGGIGIKGEDAQTAFQRIVDEKVSIKLKPAHIFPVYDYFNKNLNKIHYVFYAEVKKLGEFPVRKSSTLSWFTIKQISKLPFDEQTKQDIIVAERVIKAQARTFDPPVVNPGAIEQQA